MNETSKLIATLVIKELGGLTAVAKICKIRPQSVNNWRKRGMPKRSGQLLKALFPNLKAWDLEKEVSHA